MLGSIISAAGGAVGSLFGGLSKNKMLRQQLKMLNEKKQENQDWFDRRYNEDATQLADAQRLLTMTEESIKRRNRAAAGTAAVMGGTDESIAAEKAAGNQALSDTVSQINAAAEQRKDQIERQYNANKDNLDAAIREVTGQKKNGFDIASDMIGAVGGSLGKQVL